MQDLGEDPETVATTLAAHITPEDKAAWERGDSKSWAQEGFDIAQAKVYTVGSKPGCAPDSSPVSLPPGYEEAARDIVTIQLQKAGVRLAAVLNHSLGS